MHPKYKFILAAALFLALMSQLFLHIANIVLLPINDWDTLEMMALWSENPDYFGFHDIAHPLGMHGLFAYLKFISFFGVDPRIAWRLGILSLFLINSAIIFFSCRKLLNRSTLFSGLILLLYWASATVHDLTARGEENLVFHGLFFLALVMLYRLLSANVSKKWLFVLGGLNCVLALYHLQLAIVIALGESAAVLFSCLAQRKQVSFKPFLKNTSFQISVLVGLPLSVLVILLLTQFIVYEPLYGTMYYNLFSYADRLHYGLAYFQLLQQFLLGLPLHTPGGYQTLSFMAIVVGFLFAIGVIYISLTASHKNVLWVLLAALLFAFIYEPNSSERWDVVLIPLLLILCVTQTTTSYRVVVSLLLMSAFFVSKETVLKQKGRYGHYVAAKTGFPKDVPLVLGGKTLTRDLIGWIPFNTRILPHTALSSSDEFLVSSLEVLGESARAEQLFTIHPEGIAGWTFYLVRRKL